MALAYSAALVTLQCFPRLRARPKMVSPDNPGFVVLRTYSETGVLAALFAEVVEVGC